MDNEQKKEMDNDPSKPEKESSQHTGNTDAASNETAQSQKPGAILSARRIAAGISEAQIASRLKMSVTQVRHLEADDYAALHGMAIARGFVRAYARVLQMDPEPLVAFFAEKKNVPAPVNVQQGKPAEPFVKNREPFKSKRGASGKIVILLIIVIVALVVAWNMKLFKFDRNMQKKEMPEVIAPKAEQAPAQAVPVADSKETAPASDPASNAANKPADQAAANMAGTTNQNLNTNGPATAPAVRNTSAIVEKASDAKGALLVINFREKSWLQIQKKDGSVIAEYIGKPGEKRQLDVTEPVTVIVGFAPGVSMEFKGVPVDLVSSTSNSVAKVTLK